MANQHVLDWADALESEQYIQGHDAMKTSLQGVDSYCCMGVACEMAGVEFFATNLSPGRYGIVVVEGIISASEMPDWLNELLDLTALDNSHLVYLNDGLKYSFRQIAGLLRGWDESNSSLSFERWRRSQSGDLV